MPMDRETYENFITELNSPDLEHSRRTDILQDLRTDYNSVHSDFETLTNEKTKLEQSRLDLLESNSKLFRQAGIVGNDEKIKEEQQRSLSETITISDLEKLG